MPLCLFQNHHCFLIFLYFFFNDTATTEIYTLSLHDALPILELHPAAGEPAVPRRVRIRALPVDTQLPNPEDRKSTRLNSSHQIISYAVFCLKKKNKTKKLSNIDINKMIR